MMWKYNGNQRPDFAAEPKNGEESVWDYPRPPVVVDDDRLVVVKWLGQRIAQTVNAKRVLETASPPAFYISPNDVDEQSLRESSATSFCEWKGSATYYDIVIDGRTFERAAWSYNDPNPGFREIRGYYSFYPAEVDCFVDKQRVKPQPGSFYGGWMTPEIVGPVKGEPGSGGW